MKNKPSLTDFAQAALGVIQWAKDHGADPRAMNALLKMGEQALRQKPRVIIRLDGGLVADVFASDPQTSVSVLDEDVGDVEEPTKEEATEFAALREEMKTLTEIR